MTTRNAVIIGLVLGVVCACIVWYLERFESNRLHAEVREYLTKYDEFSEWLSKKKTDPQS